MIAIMHKRTKISCESLVQDAINSYPVSTLQNYIKKNYAKNTHQWDIWAYQYSSLLLQITSTNLLESFHNELKRITSPLYGLIGEQVFLFYLSAPYSRTMISVQNVVKIFEIKL